MCDSFTGRLLSFCMRVCVLLHLIFSTPALLLHAQQTSVPALTDSLTLSQLHTQLLEASQSICERADSGRADRICSLQEMASRNLLATRLENLPLRRCRVARSNIAEAGNGVFACRDIALGELVTLYPGDGVLVQADDAVARGDDKSSTQWKIEEPDGSRRSTDESVLERGKDYEREVESMGSVSVVGDPRLVGDPAYIGHIINDGVTCARDALRSAYVTEAGLVCNVHQCSVHACHVAIVATRDIRRGEELLMSYGARYWISRLSSSSADYEGRLLEDYWIEEDLDEEYVHHRTRSSSRHRETRRRGGRHLRRGTSTS